MIDCMQNQDPLLRLTNVIKRFGKEQAGVGPISLQLFAGEGIALCGQNGAGKSTLLKLMAGIWSPDQGSCWRSPELTGQISYVPQDIALYDSLTGLENLAFWGRVYGLPSKVIRVRSHWLLEQLKLTDKAKHKVQTYSGGMRRRLHLATALMITPRLLLLDEPTVGADVESVQLILKLLQHVRQQGCSLVFISHQLGEMEQICTRALTLQQGILCEERRL